VSQPSHFHSFLPASPPPPHLVSFNPLLCPTARIVCKSKFVFSITECRRGKTKPIGREGGEGECLNEQMRWSISLTFPLYLWYYFATKGKRRWSVANLWFEIPNQVWRETEIDIHSDMMPPDYWNWRFFTDKNAPLLDCSPAQQPNLIRDITNSLFRCVYVAIEGYVTIESICNWLTITSSLRLRIFVINDFLWTSFTDLFEGNLKERVDTTVIVLRIVI